MKSTEEPTVIYISSDDDEKRDVSQINIEKNSQEPALLVKIPNESFHYSCKSSEQKIIKPEREARKIIQEIPQFVARNAPNQHEVDIEMVEKGNNNYNHSSILKSKQKVSNDKRKRENSSPTGKKSQKSPLKKKLKRGVQHQDYSSSDDEPLAVRIRRYKSRTNSTSSSDVEYFSASSKQSLRTEVDLNLDKIRLQHFRDTILTIAPRLTTLDEKTVIKQMEIATGKEGLDRLGSFLIQCFYNNILLLPGLSNFKKFTTNDPDRPVIKAFIKDTLKLTKESDTNFIKDTLKLTKESDTNSIQLPSTLESQLLNSKTSADDREGSCLLVSESSDVDSLRLTNVNKKRRKTGRERANESQNKTNLNNSKTSKKSEKSEKVTKSSDEKTGAVSLNSTNNSMKSQKRNTRASLNNSKASEKDAESPTKSYGHRKRTSFPEQNMDDSNSNHSVVSNKENSLSNKKNQGKRSAYHTYNDKCLHDSIPISKSKNSSASTKETKQVDNADLEEVEKIQSSEDEEENFFFITKEHLLSWRIVLERLNLSNKKRFQVHCVDGNWKVKDEEQKENTQKISENGYTQNEEERHLDKVSIQFQDTNQVEEEKKNIQQDEVPTNENPKKLKVVDECFTKMETSLSVDDSSRYHVDQIEEKIPEKSTIQERSLVIEKLTTILTKNSAESKEQPSEVFNSKDNFEHQNEPKDISEKSKALNEALTQVMNKLIDSVEEPKKTPENASDLNDLQSDDTIIIDDDDESMEVPKAMVYFTPKKNFEYKAFEENKHIYSTPKAAFGNDIKEIETLKDSPMKFIGPKTSTPIKSVHKEITPEKTFTEPKQLEMPCENLITQENNIEKKPADDDSLEIIEQEIDLIVIDDIDDESNDKPGNSSKSQQIFVSTKNIKKEPEQDSRETLTLRIPTPPPCSTSNQTTQQVTASTKPPLSTRCPQDIQNEFTDANNGSNQANSNVAEESIQQLIPVTIAPNTSTMTNFNQTTDSMIGQQRSSTLPVPPSVQAPVKNTPSSLQQSSMNNPVSNNNEYGSRFLIVYTEKHLNSVAVLKTVPIIIKSPGNGNVNLTPQMFQQILSNIRPITNCSVQNVVPNIERSMIRPTARVNPTLKEFGLPLATENIPQHSRSMVSPKPIQRTNSKQQEAESASFEMVPSKQIYNESVQKANTSIEKVPSGSGTQANFVLTKAFRPYLTTFDVKRADLIANMLKTDNLKRFFKCMASNCDFCCDSKKEFYQHLTGHTRLLSYSCSYCSKVFNKPLELVQHMQSNYINCHLYCGVCFYRSSFAYNLEEHSKFHQGIKRPFALGVLKYIKPINEDEVYQNISVKQTENFQCPVDKCSACFNTKFLFNQHYYSKHTSFPKFDCNGCGRKNIEEIIGDHYAFCAKLFDYYCCYCHFETNVLEEMSMHLVKNHMQNVPFYQERTDTSHLKNSSLIKAACIKKFTSSGSTHHFTSS